MMIGLNRYEQSIIASNNNDKRSIDSECQSECHSRDDELTLITTNNNLTDRPQSIIDDDVGPDTNLDLVPVRECRARRIDYPDQIEIIDVRERVQSYEDKSGINRREDSIDSLQRSIKRTVPIHEVDEYDLETHKYGFNESNKYCEELLETVKYRPQPSVILTKHETPSLDTQHDSHMSSLFSKQQARALTSVSSPHHSVQSPVTTDIGKQITQLARRIESLGNISRICQDDIENCPVLICGTQDNRHSHVHPHSHCVMSDSCHEPLDGHVNTDHYSIKAARKLDEIGRLQKKQEAMQNRLVDLARKLNDSTRDLTRLPDASSAYEDVATNNDYFHGKIPKSIKKSNRKTGQKSRRSNKISTKQSSSFLRNILGDVNETKPNELPLLSSSYCLHNDLSTGTPDTGISESTSKYLNDELSNIRQEFRTQVEEIRKLLSERYQQLSESSKPNPNLQGPHQCPHPCTHHSSDCCRRLDKDHSPSLRNITNINNNNSEDCPLDKYLAKSSKTTELPTIESEAVPSLRPGILPSVARAIKNKQRMLSDPVEAEKFLIELANRRANLENNLRCLERTKEGEFLFSILEKLQGTDTNVDLARIQALVDDAISSMAPIVKQDVKNEFSIWIDKRRKQKEQQLIAEEEEKQMMSKIKSIKTTKTFHSRNYNPPSSSSSVTGKPWICKRYLTVQSKVDSGVRKPQAEIICRSSRSQSPPKRASVPPSYTHTAWSNRRRYRSPYLHFINDVKLAKKPVVPLGEARPAPPTNRWTKKSEVKTTRSIRQVPNDDLVLMSVKQYSLDYKEAEEEVVQTQPVKLFTRSTSPPTVSESSTSSSKSKLSIDDNVHNNDASKTCEIAIQTPRNQPEKPVSPTFSEKGTGFQVISKPSLKRREERIEPFAPVDPTETIKLISNPVIVTSKPETKPDGPDINSLRHLIERALLDQIQIPSPVISNDKSELLTRIENVPTPLPTERGDDYSPQFSPEDLDRTLSPIGNYRTPEASQVISEYSFKPSRVSTPSKSHVSSEKVVSRRSPKMVSEAIQTITNAAVQTEEEKEIQAKPTSIYTQTPNTVRHPSEKTGSTTSDFSASLSDTAVHSFSDGMWLYDRSEGEMAPYQIETVTRWQLGDCPDNPLWFNGTDDLMNIDRHSSLSCGEFTRPTLPGLIPTRDPVLQLNTIPFRPPPPGSPHNDTHDRDDLLYLNHRQSGSPTHFRSLGVSRDSRSRVPWVDVNQQYTGASTGRGNSDGEIEIENDRAQGNASDGEHRPEQPGRPATTNQSIINESIDYDDNDNRRSSPFLININRSNDSRVFSDHDVPYRNSQSDRMNPIDLNQYLRASRQSDLSDTAGLLSTGQIVASAFRGNDSIDVDQYSDNGALDNHHQHQNQQTQHQINSKPTVRIPSLGTLEQSDGSSSDDHLEIINI